MWENISIDNNSSLFVERIMKENMWSKDYTLRVIDEYKKFLYIGSIQSVSPSFEIDQVWHTHILFTKDYEKMCKALMNRFFHHNPIDKTDSVSVSTDRYAETKEKYKELFGYEPPSDIWTPWKETHYIYVDLNKHWVIPANDWKALVKLLLTYFKN